MRIEGGLVESRFLEAPVAEKIVGNKMSAKKKKRRQKKQASPPPAPPGPTGVQRLYQVCKEVFSDGAAGIVPCPEDVERIRSVLDSMKPSDVNLTPNMPYFRNAYTEMEAAPVTYLHLYECDKFSICIFCLPPSAVIPLHNHPGMTVFSKILFGSMHIKSYDWADVPQVSNQRTNAIHYQPPGVRLAKVKTNSLFTAPCNTSILYPDAGGNMHCFSARSSCAVLDVLGPPYCDPEGRHCTYYNEFPCASFSGGTDDMPLDGDCAWLEEREKPDDFFVLGGKYMGPHIMDH